MEAPPGLAPNGAGTRKYALPPSGHTRRASVSTEVAMKSNNEHPLLLLVIKLFDRMNKKENITSIPTMINTINWYTCSFCNISLQELLKNHFVQQIHLDRPFLPDLASPQSKEREKFEAELIPVVASAAGVTMDRIEIIDVYENKVLSR